MSDWVPAVGFAILSLTTYHYGFVVLVGAMAVFIQFGFVVCLIGFVITLTH